MLNFKEAKKIFEEKYDTTLTNWYDNRLKFICLKHGSFIRSKKEFLEGKGCPVCLKKEEENKAFFTNVVVREFKNIHGNKYDYSHTDFTDSTTKIKVKCPVHGFFTIYPSEHLNGKGCPYCSGEKKKVKIVVKKKNPVFQPKEKTQPKFQPKEKFQPKFQPKEKRTKIAKKKFIPVTLKKDFLKKYLLKKYPDLIINKTFDNLIDGKYHPAYDFYIPSLKTVVIYIGLDGNDKKANELKQYRIFLKKKFARKNKLTYVIAKFSSKIENLKV